MIRLDEITFWYDGETEPTLTDVNLQLDEGELALVAGRTGSGKSTLLGLFNGLVPHFTGGTLAGDVLVDGESIIGRPPRELVHLVGYVAQDPLSGFVADVVEEELAYGMEQLGLDPQTNARPAGYRALAQQSNPVAVGRPATAGGDRGSVDHASASACP